MAGGLYRIGLLASIAALVVLTAMIVLSVGPRLLGYSSFVVYGGSMEPAVPKGSVAVGKRVSPASLRAGDIIVYRAQGAPTPTLHRIVAIDLDRETLVFTTKGDANDAPDPSQLRLVGQGTRVLYSVPYAGFVLHASSTRWGPILFIWLPALLLLALLLWTIWRPATRPRGHAPPLDEGRLAIGG